MLLKKSLQPQRHCICRCLQSAYVCMQKMTHTECVDLTLRNQQQMQPQLKQSRQLQQNNHRNVMAFGLVCILCHVQRSVSQCTGLFLQESSTTTEEKPANTEASATSLLAVCQQAHLHATNLCEPFPQAGFPAEPSDTGAATAETMPAAATEQPQECHGICIFFIVLPPVAVCGFLVKPSSSLLPLYCLFTASLLPLYCLFTASLHFI